MNVDLLTIASVPAVIALTEVIKRLEIMPNRALPIVAVLLGISVQIASHVSEGGATDPRALLGAALTGIVLGLAASGVYDTANTASGSQADSTNSHSDAEVIAESEGWAAEGDPAGLA